MIPHPARIASLVPSLTETLFELGLGASVVARTGYCIHPAAQVGAVPKVGGTKQVNLKKLARLAPTHVLLNRDENTLDTLAAVQAFESAPRILANHPLSPQDNYSIFQELGKVFGAQVAADALAKRFERELLAVQAHSWPQRRVLYLIWQDPWMTVARNTYISQTLALFGLHTFPSVTGKLVGASRYPAIPDLAACVHAQGIDAVLLSSEPYAFTPKDCDALQAQLGVPVHLVDGEMTSWYGSRAIAALPYLAQFVGALGKKAAQTSW